MDQNSNTESPPLPGIIATLVAGFELATSQIWLVAFPVVLDLFLWIGPRLRITDLVAEMVEVLSGEPEIAELVDIIVEVGPQINLFTFLSLPIIGVPTLMGEFIPEETPIGPVTYEVAGEYSYMLIVVALSLIGIGLTALYLYLIGRVIKKSDEIEHLTFSENLHSLFVAFIRLLGFIIVFSLILLLLAIPLLPVAFIFGMINSNLVAGVMLVAFIVVAAYLSLAIPGIVMNNRPIFMAIRESIKLVIKNLMTTLNFLVIVFLIAIGTNLLWHLPEYGSWFTFVGILGHAFISTALATAIFIYYRDRYSFFIGNELRVAE
jgi:hypothetical protein